MDIKTIERILQEKKAKEETTAGEVLELMRIRKLPFHLRIQEKGQEKYLQDFEARRKETFLTYSVKKWSIPKDEGLELFQEFFTEFLKGEVKSIYDFMIKRGYEVKDVN
jgi:hypothetical protein